MPLFPGEIYTERDTLLFSNLHSRLIERIRMRIRSGALTERALAKRAGLSQPHVHNLLKGVRSLSADSADALLRAISAGIIDLLGDAEEDFAGAEPTVAVPVLGGAVGPGGSWSDEIESAAGWEIPCRVAALLASPAVLRLNTDPAMGIDSGYVLVNRAQQARRAVGPVDLCVVALDNGACVRYVRVGRQVLYLPTARNLSCPIEWAITPKTADVTQVVRAIVYPAFEISSVIPLPAGIFRVPPRLCDPN